MRKLAERSQKAAAEISELSSSSVEVAVKAGDMLTRKPWPGTRASDGTPGNCYARKYYSWSRFMGGTLELFRSSPVGVEYIAPPAPEPEPEPGVELVALVWLHPTIPNPMRQSNDQAVERIFFMTLDPLF